MEEYLRVYTLWLNSFQMPENVQMGAEDVGKSE